jgi:cytidine deaminase
MADVNRLRLASKEKQGSPYIAICGRALQAAKGAFAPISGFAVGVVIRATDQQEFTGQNQENSAFDSIHAEMAALANWNSAGEPKIETIAIAGFRFWPHHDKSKLVTPCGRCRQWLFEAIIRSKSSPEIVCANGDLSIIKPFKINELLPEAFSTDDHAALYSDWYSNLRRLLQQS